MSDLPIRLPEGATDVVTDGPAPFVTGVRYRGPDGVLVRWEARASRRVAPAHGRGLTWWIGLLFAIGATAFVVGPIPAYTHAVGARADALTYFVGSLFFTAGGYLTYLQVVRASGRRWFGWLPRALGFWAATVQLVGTLYFNVTTFAGLLDLPADLDERVVWRPDAIGSVCFLVASAIAFAEAGHRWWSWRPGHLDWHITALNMWGSIFFGLSAIGAHIGPDGSLTSVQLANGGTFAGALCFLVGAVLTMSEGRAASSGADPGPVAPPRPRR
ncbi:YrhK family protein [Nocardioides sp. URHA0020]|uniref:YrhK family protein n=1 Tax=Nocardioides sp. URHA0020 TaxID=1380392 RepID=UPI000684E90C|nr:YrhK family protein [Nocardioides sp. URHA0020]